MTTSKSTKSSSASRGRRRYVEFRLSEPDDLKYLWAAYRKGAFNHIHPVFLEDLSTQEFKDAMALYLEEGGFTPWTMVAETKDGVRPVALLLGLVTERVINLAKLVPFPWASPRNVLESMSNALDTIRKQVYDESLEIDDPLRYVMAILFTDYRDKKFYEKIQDMGILRKVGHVYHMHPETNILFQTRSPVRGK